MRSIIAITLAAALATPAIASGDPVSIAVSTSDLNLTSAAGQRALAGRINRAARAVCTSGERSLAAITAENACIADARADAVAQMPGVITISSITVRRARA